MKRICMLSVVIAAVAGCPISGPREGIGAVCVPGDAVCPLDYYCLPDDVEQTSGMCAPVLDYGSCDAPGWPIRVAEVRDETLEVDTVDDLDFLLDVSRVEGDLIIAPSGAGQTLQLGALCDISGLQQVTGSLLVKNTDLTSLDGLQGLSSVGAGLGIAGNRLLTDIQGLTNLVSATARAGDDFNIVIADNATLPAAAIVELRQAIQASGVTTARLYACGNARGGNDDPECTASVDDLLRR